MDAEAAINTLATAAPQFLDGAWATYFTLKGWLAANGWVGVVMFISSISLYFYFKDTN